MTISNYYRVCLSIVTEMFSKIKLEGTDDAKFQLTKLKTHALVFKNLILLIKTHAKSAPRNMILAALKFGKSFIEALLKARFPIANLFIILLNKYIPL